MSDKEQKREAGELELDAETVADLEPDDEAADGIRGGNSFTCPSGTTNVGVNKCQIN